MIEARWWLVCYDVHDPKRLRRAASVMEGAGQRMQYSVFRCWMTPAQMHEPAVGADPGPGTGGRGPADPALPPMRGGDGDDAPGEECARLARRTRGVPRRLTPPSSPVQVPTDVPLGNAAHRR